MRTRLALVVAALLPIVAVAHAQTPTLVGVVRDSAGVPVQSAEVSVLGRKAISDSLGRFYLSLPAADSMTINVRRLGYESVSFSVTSKDIADNSLDVVLRRVATTLESVEVTAMEDRAKTSLRGYDERRSRGLGTFVTREEIEQRNTRQLTDVLRQARGVVVKGKQIMFSQYQNRNCQPMLWLDGQQVPGLPLEAISATDVEGVELYQSLSNTPPEFHRTQGGTIECGTIVVWTKRPMLEVKKKKP